MSRIGRTPIKIADGVALTITPDLVTVKGAKGELSQRILEGITVEEKDGFVIVNRRDDSREQKAYHGLIRALINNMIIGVSAGYEKNLQVIGTGYSAERVGPWLRLSLGYSHDILMEVPSHLTVAAEVVPRREQGPLGVQAKIKVSGILKEDVGKFSAEIRGCRPPENYKGKGVRYEGEHVVIKPGKSGAKG
ncbi:MAG: 50S ribosomal protein L6 [Candidatus Cloacimonetes bacterium]|nr:50S ribosomal protein L6 [Candidatus Cloacimonadota bacterium]